MGIADLHNYCYCSAHSKGFSVIAEERYNILNMILRPNNRNDLCPADQPSTFAIPIHATFSSQYTEQINERSKGLWHPHCIITVAVYCFFLWSMRWKVIISLVVKILINELPSLARWPGSTARGTTLSLWSHYPPHAIEPSHLATAIVAWNCRVIFPIHASREG